jgi:NAD-reducing hydrogenase small subunit
MARLKLATTWFGGCSGCHMSFLDLDEWLLELAALADVVYCPLVDHKEYPEGVDLALLEGAIANEEHLHMVRLIRERTRAVVAFGDCAVTGNVTSLRNPLGGADVVLRRSYLEGGDVNPRVPEEPGVLPVLLDRVVPLHEVIHVDYFLPGCPPPAERIRALLQPLLAGETPHLMGEDLKFG